MYLHLDNIFIRLLKPPSGRNRRLNTVPLHSISKFASAGRSFSIELLVVY